MTSDGLLIVQFLFSQIWTFFTSWHIPGTGVTPGGFLLFLLSASIGLRIIMHLFNQSVDGNVTGHIREVDK